MKTYFYKPTKGLKADVERHRAKEAELTAKIAKLEAIENPTESDTVFLRTYRNIRNSLSQSKAEVVSKIGKK
jgi:hypothetical protein